MGGRDWLKIQLFLKKKKWLSEFYFLGIHTWILSSRNTSLMSHKHFQQQIINQTTQNIHLEKKCIKWLWSFLDSDLKLASGYVILSGRCLCVRQRRKRRPTQRTLFYTSFCQQQHRAAQGRMASPSPGNTGVWHFLIIWAGENEDFSK